VMDVVDAGSVMVLSEPDVNGNVATCRVLVPSVTNNLELTQSGTSWVLEFVLIEIELVTFMVCP